MIPCLVMSRTFGLPVCVFFLIGCFLPAAISSIKWKLDNDFENNLDTSELLWEKDGISMLTCGNLCTQKQSCISFFYNPSLKKCLGSKSFKRGLPAGHGTQQEWKYYTKAQQCDRGYTYNETLELCYKVHYETINNSDAMAACELEEAKLIIIRNEIEYQHIQSLTSVVWIGLRRMGTSFVWKWWNAQAASSFHWYPGSPDNFGGKQTCVTICYGTHRDDDCDILRPFICQKYI